MRLSELEATRGDFQVWLEDAANIPLTGLREVIGSLKQ